MCQASPGAFTEAQTRVKLENLLLLAMHGALHSHVIDFLLLPQVLTEEAASLEQQAPKLAAKAVELTKQLQKEEEVGYSCKDFIHINLSHHKLEQNQKEPRQANATFQSCYMTSPLNGLPTIILQFWYFAGNCVLHANHDLQDQSARRFSYIR